MNSNTNVAAIEFKPHQVKVDFILLLKLYAYLSVDHNAKGLMEQIERAEDPTKEKE